MERLGNVTGGKNVEVEVRGQLLTPSLWSMVLLYMYLSMLYSALLPRSIAVYIASSHLALVAASRSALKYSGIHVHAPSHQ